MATDPHPSKPSAAVPKANPAPAKRAERVAQPAGQQAMQSQAATAETDSPDDEAAEDAPRSGRFVLFNAVPAWLVSLVFHMVLLIILAITLQPQIAKELDRVMEATMNPEAEEETVEEFEVQEIEMVEVETTDVTDAAVPVTADIPETVVTEVTMANDVDAAPIKIELTDVSSKTAPKSDLMATIGSVAGSGLEGRGAAERGKMIKKYGGNEASEAAVARALKWLAAHQLPNGAWSFDHRQCPNCQGKCSHPGSLSNGYNGATAMALLPFLGAGQTHKSGKYKETVQRGLYFLVNNGKAKPGPRGEWSESGGSMYSHGLAAITLCEAYAMTQDRELMVPAQLSINHIVYAQDPVGGGWRYQPKQPGDTSAVGWQLMALKSGHMAYLQVPPVTVQGAMRFLDSVQSDSGAKYGYTSPGSGQATTAVGLLCRMYLGWKKDNGALHRGVEFLSQKGPSANNMYYNYYATQVMRHFEGEMWDKWNTKMRDSLVNSQIKRGHEEGSWHMGRGDHGSERGGRLYCTSMATMILEVYYRHLPIYGKQAAEEDFPL